MEQHQSTSAVSSSMEVTKNSDIHIATIPSVTAYVPIVAGTHIDTIAESSAPNSVPTVVEIEHSSHTYTGTTAESCVTNEPAVTTSRGVKKQYTWACNVWADWARTTNDKLSQDEQKCSENFKDLTVEQMNYWLSKFVLEVRKANGDSYPPESVYQLCCGLQRMLRVNNIDIRFFEDPRLSGFKTTLDNEMKRLTDTGDYAVKRQTQPITAEQEDRLWELGLLGDSTPAALAHTMVWNACLYFGLRSGHEHRELRHYPSQITLVQPPLGKPYLVYREDISKVKQGNRAPKKPKEIVCYSNEIRPERCFIRLYRLYNSRCPTQRPASVFYLQPLQMPKSHVWYSTQPIGHNTIQNIVPNIMKQAGFEGYYNKQSLVLQGTARLAGAILQQQMRVLAQTGQDHFSRSELRSKRHSSTGELQIQAVSTGDEVRRPSTSSSVDEQLATDQSNTASKLRPIRMKDLPQTNEPQQTQGHSSTDNLRPQKRASEREDTVDSEMPGTKKAKTTEEEATDKQDEQVQCPPSDQVINIRASDHNSRLPVFHITGGTVTINIHQ